MTDVKVIPNKKIANAPSPADSDKIVMQKIWGIVSRGNNAEVKRKKDGTLTVIEVKKNIV